MSLLGSSEQMSDVQNDLSGKRRFSIYFQLVYGLGHILNDVCASMWFTYLLVYFQFVLGFGAKEAGLLLLIGQIADALATPFVGFHSDTSHPSSLCSYGRRKSWHLLGTICVIGSFPFIFSECLSCENSHKWAQLIYYSAFVIIFQFGWAAVQVSHLSLIPELSTNEHERTHLTAVRYSFTVFSNLLVYVVTWVTLHITDESNQQIGPDDKHKFHEIVGIGVGLGTISSLLFHLLLKEPKPINLSIQNDPYYIHDRKSVVVSYKEILKTLKFYKIGIIYMCTRLFVNLSQVLIPLYLHKTLNLPGVALAYVPLVMYLSSLAMSILVRPINRILGRKGAYTAGGIVGVIGCVWIFVGKDLTFSKYEIYFVVIVLGAGGALILVTSLGLTADLIGNATNTAAFVYGTMSFSDKLSNGLAVILIEHLAESADSDFYRWAVSFGCGCPAIIAILTVLNLSSNSLSIPSEEETPILNSSES